SEPSAPTTSSTTSTIAVTRSQGDAWPSPMFERTARSRARVSRVADVVPTFARCCRCFPLRGFWPLLPTADDATDRDGRRESVRASRRARVPGIAVRARLTPGTLVPAGTIEPDVREREVRERGCAGWAQVPSVAHPVALAVHILRP